VSPRHRYSGMGVVVGSGGLRPSIAGSAHGFYPVIDASGGIAVGQRKSRGSGHHAGGKYGEGCLGPSYAATSIAGLRASPGL
jgi:hypothetical protein